MYKNQFLYLNAYAVYCVYETNIDQSMHTWVYNEQDRPEDHPPKTRVSLKQPWEPILQLYGLAPELRACSRLLCVRGVDVSDSGGEVLSPDNGPAYLSYRTATCQRHSQS